ncbi:unnamed protein product [Amoebophrya sp. A120]|nr:unnamed protein product [Amoebophrya sp. A120]|eukprot:GSA120T00002258001.1
MEHACAANTKNIRQDVEKKIGMSKYHEYYPHIVLAPSGGSPTSSEAGQKIKVVGALKKTEAEEEEASKTMTNSKTSLSRFKQGLEKKLKRPGQNKNQEMLESLQMPEFLSHSEIRNIDRQLDEEVRKNSLQKAGESEEDNKTEDVEHGGIAVLHELLLDSLLTACEGGKVITKVRQNFDVSKQPIPEPTSAKEWLQVKKNILKAGKRLELFRQVLEAKVKRRLMNILIDNAEKKIDINKQQSVILWQYSEEFQSRMQTIEAQIQELREKKDVLAQKLKPLVVGE